MTELRIDKVQIRAVVTDQGFLVDEPVAGRAGIQFYHRPDGSIQRELRLPEEVFNPKSLKSGEGKPITLGHPKERKVTAENAARLVCGSVLKLYQDQEDDTALRASVVVYRRDAVDSIVSKEAYELSFGYTVDLEETPGIWEGQEYDAIQRNIQIDHLSIEKRGRAGNAKFNVDSSYGMAYADCFLSTGKEINMSEKPDNLAKIRLDSGLEYPAAPEIAVEFEKIRKDNKELEPKLSKIEGERDALKSRVDSFDADMKKAREDAQAEITEAVKTRLKLESGVKEFKINCDGLSDREIKIAVIKAVSPELKMDGRSDEYIDAAYDATVCHKPAISSHRAIVNDSAAGGAMSYEDAYKRKVKEVTIQSYGGK